MARCNERGGERMGGKGSRKREEGGTKENSKIAEMTVNRRGQERSQRQERERSAVLHDKRSKEEI